MRLFHFIVSITINDINNVLENNVSSNYDEQASLSLSDSTSVSSNLNINLNSIISQPCLNSSLRQ